MRDQRYQRARERKRGREATLVEREREINERELMQSVREKGRECERGSRVGASGAHKRYQR